MNFFSNYTMMSFLVPFSIAYHPSAVAFSYRQWGDAFGPVLHTHILL